MKWVESFEQLYNFLSVVIVSAPNDFQKKDFLPEEDQLNLERAFLELNNGMEFVEKKIDDETVVSKAQSLLDEALEAYKSGNRKKGAFLLQDFDELVFGKK